VRAIVFCFALKLGHRSKQPALRIWANKRHALLFDHFVGRGRAVLAAHGVRPKHLIHVKRGVRKNVRLHSGLGSVFWAEHGTRLARSASTQRSCTGEMRTYGEAESEDTEVCCRGGDRVRVSIASPHVRPSPNDRRVGIRIRTFEACSGFTLLRPIGSLSSPRPPSSQGSDPASYPAERPASFRTNRQLSG
jgi:hypothetical protein